MTKSRIVMLIAAVVFEFAAIIGILLRVMPGARKPTDYLVIGTMATFVALGTMFVVLLASSGDRSVFRKKPGPPKSD
jgi:hypothetical protein